MQDSIRQHLELAKNQAAFGPGAPLAQFHGTEYPVLQGPMTRVSDTAAFAEAMALRNCIKTFGARGEWATAAERFADYWGGAGTWRDMSSERRVAFAQALEPNYFEWDAVMNETTSPEQWAGLLPAATLLAHDPGTVLPIREIAAILRGACPAWTCCELPGAGHMAPLTRPDLVNPLVRSFLSA
jgi:pimeloyl-ACP methyl ester carboxylesterase